MGGEEEVEGGVGDIRLQNSLCLVSTTSSLQIVMVVPTVVMVMDGRDEERRNVNLKKAGTVRRH